MNSVFPKYVNVKNVPYHYNKQKPPHIMEIPSGFPQEDSMIN